MSDKILKKLLRYANLQDAEDAIQDAYLKILKRKDDNTYLENVAFQKLFDNYRKNKKHFHKYNLIEENNNIEKIKIRRFLISNWDTDAIEANNVVKKIYSRLTVSQQNLLAIFIEAECNVIRAAEISNYSESSFKVLIHKLKKTLRREDFL